MRPEQMRVWLLLGLAGTLAAAWFAPQGDAEVVAAQVPLSGRTDDAQGARGTRSVGAGGGLAPSSLDVLAIRARGSESDGDRLGSLFSAAPWAAPKPQAPAADQPVAPEVAASPEPPPLPFKELGRYADAGRMVVFVQYGDQNLLVRQGDTLAGSYHVEEITGTAMKLRYLPLDQVQTLELSPAP